MGMLAGGRLGSERRSLHRPTGIRAVLEILEHEVGKRVGFRVAGPGRAMQDLACGGQIRRDSWPTGAAHPLQRPAQHFAFTGMPATQFLDPRFETAIRVQARDLLTRSSEIRGQAVIVPGRNGIELVVVTTRAGNGQSQEGLREHVDLVVDAIRFVQGGIHRSMGGLVQVPPTGPDDRLVEACRRMSPGRPKQIARDVFPHELVVGNIRIEGPDQVIAIPPGVRDVEVLFMPIGFGEANEVHPVARPAFTVMRRCQQTVQHPRAPGL